MERVERAEGALTRLYHASYTAQRQLSDTVKMKKPGDGLTCSAASSRNALHITCEASRRVFMIKNKNLQMDFYISGPERENIS